MTSGEAPAEEHHDGVAGVDWTAVEVSGRAVVWAKLGLSVGSPVTALIKATEVMLGVED